MDSSSTLQGNNQQLISSKFTYTNYELLISTLRNQFQLENFRPGQIEIIQSILSGSNTLAILPTGGGKSLCYQLPAVLSEGTTIVFSPLISLMKDQVDSLRKRNIPATFLNSSLNEDTQRRRLDNLKNNQYKLFFVAPERLTSKSFTNALEKSDISNVVIDEAHCISEWGHNFRPMYLKISTIFNYIRRVPVSAFTATATPEVRADIIKYLKLNEPSIFVRGFARTNLALKSEIVKDKKSRLLELMKSHQNGSKIIYVGTRKNTLEYSDFLNSKNIPAIPYNGGLPAEERKIIQDKFIKNEINTIVATNAFGMGIDKPDVRLVVHLDLPSTLEAYYQEAGRAGRDGLASFCHLLYSKNDEKLPSLFIYGAFPDITEIRKVIRGINELVRIRKNYFVKGSVAELSGIFNLDSQKLRTILKLLKRKELIEFYDDAQLVQYSVNSENPDFTRISEHFHKNRKEIFNYLLNSEKEKNELDLKDLANEFAVSLESCDSEIRSFESLGLITIKRNLHFSGIKLTHHPLEEEIIDNLLIEIEERKQILISKANTMLDYIRTENCKQEFILNYFGEINENYHCGMCSACLGEKSDITSIESVHVHNFKKEISRKAAINQEIFAKLNTLLDESDSLELLSLNMKMTKPELANMMQSSIEEGWRVKPVKFISQKLLEEVRAILSKNSNLRLSQIRERLNLEIDFPELRIAVAIVRKQIN